MPAAGRRPGCARINHGAGAVPPAGAAHGRPHTHSRPDFSVAGEVMRRRMGKGHSITKLVAARPASHACALLLLLPLHLLLPPPLLRLRPLIAHHRTVRGERDARHHTTSYDVL